MRKSIRALCLLVLLGAGLFGAGPATAGNHDSSPCRNGGTVVRDDAVSDGTYVNYDETTKPGEHYEGTIDPPGEENDAADNVAEGFLGNVPEVGDGVENPNEPGEYVFEPEHDTTAQTVRTRRDFGDLDLTISFAAPTCRSVRYTLTVYDYEGADDTDVTDNPVKHQEQRLGDGQTALQWIDVQIDTFGQSEDESIVVIGMRTETRGRGEQIDSAFAYIDDTAGGGSSWFS